jgi:hypothetical protein
MSPEYAIGLEALRNLPVRETLLPYDEALARLTQRTRSSVESNIQTLIDSSTAVGQKTPGNLLFLQQSLDSWLNPGGYSLNESELIYVLENKGNATLYQTLRFFVEHVFPEFASRLPITRNPGCVAVGYLLDFLDIIRPEFASRKDAISLIAQVASELPDANFNLGVYFDDATEGAGTLTLPMDIIMNTQSARELKDA